MVHKVPSSFTNSEWFAPAATATTLLATMAGRLVLVGVLPRPNWPALLRPMAHRVPSDSTNREWLSPVATATAWLLTVTGVFCWVRLPLPNWPSSLKPQALSGALGTLSSAGRLRTMPSAFVIATR